MSELDLNQPLTPPEGPAEGVSLTPPAAVPEVGGDQAVGMVAVPADKRAELQAKADEFVAGLSTVEPGSPEFTRKVDKIARMGVQEIRSSSEVSNRMLQRPESSLAAARGRGGPSDPQTQVAQTLQQLRTTITDLDPGHTNLAKIGRAHV